jgi:hypothetical protein
MVGLLGACAVLLAVAGGTKVAAPKATVAAFAATRLPGARSLAKTLVIRTFGVTEIGLALLAVVVGGAVPAGLVALAYVILGVVAWRLVRYAPGQDCGCFGSSAEPASNWHVGVDVGAALIAGAATIWPTPSLVHELGRGGIAAVLLPIAVLVLAWLGYLLMTALPELLNLDAKVGAIR